MFPAGRIPEGSPGGAPNLPRLAIARLRASLPGARQSSPPRMPRAFPGSRAKTEPRQPLGAQKRVSEIKSETWITRCADRYRMIGHERSEVSGGVRRWAEETVRTCGGGWLALQARVGGLLGAGHPRSPLACPHRLVHPQCQVKPAPNASKGSGCGGAWGTPVPRAPGGDSPAHGGAARCCRAAATIRSGLGPRGACRRAPDRGTRSRRTTRGGRSPGGCRLDQRGPPPLS